MDYTKYLSQVNRQRPFILLGDLVGTAFCIVNEPTFINRTETRNCKVRLNIDVKDCGLRTLDLSNPQFEKILLWMQSNNVTFNEFFVISDMNKVTLNRKCSEFVFTINKLGDIQHGLHGTNQQPSESDRLVEAGVEEPKKSVEPLVVAHQPVASTVDDLKLRKDAMKWWQSEVMGMHAAYHNKLKCERDVAMHLSVLKQLRDEFMMTLEHQLYDVLQQADKDVVAKAIPDEYAWLRFITPYVKSCPN